MELKRFIRYAGLACVALLPLIGAEYRGQVKFGDLPLPGVTIVASQGEKKVSAVTDSNGVYDFPDLPDGTYQFDVEKLGFTGEKKDVTVGSGLPGPVFSLDMLPLDKIETVSAPPPAPAAGGSGPSDTVTSNQAQPNGNQASNSKNNGKTPAPGPMQASSFQRTNLKGSANAPQQQAANEPPAEVSSELNQRAADGMLINGSAQNGASSPFAQSPAFGNNRRGGPRLYRYDLRVTESNSSLNANQYSLNGAKTDKPPANNFSGGFQFGGPLRIPRLVSQRDNVNVTLSYQRVINRTANIVSGTMPEDAMRSGDFSNATGIGGAPVQVFDPFTNQPFVDNQIPVSRLSPEALALLQYYPKPNFTGGSGYNYQVPLISNTHTDSFRIQVNKSFKRKNTISVLFQMNDTRGDNATEFNFLDLNRSRGMQGTVTYRRSFTPRFYGTFTYQFNRYSVQSIPFFANGTNVSGAAGITGNDQSPLNYGPPALSFNQSSISRLSDTNASINHNQASVYSYLGTWNHGRHNIQFGGDFRWQQVNIYGQSNPRGQFTFTGAATQQLDVNGNLVPNTGYDFADFLLGVPDQSAIAFGNADKYFRSKSPDFFIKDDWKVTPGLSLSLVGRWDYNSPITELYGRLVNLDIASGFSAALPVVANSPTGLLTGTTYPASLVHPDKHEFTPQIGVAWRPFPASSMVVRAGYGIAYNTNVYNYFANQMAQQSPLSKALNVKNGPGNPLTLANGFYAQPNETTNTFALDPNFRVGYAQTWYASVQRDLPASLVMLATYTGIKGTHQPQAFVPNTYPSEDLNPCPNCPSSFTYYTSGGNSERESGALQLRRRLHNGFTASLTYTYSKSIDDAATLGTSAGQQPAQNWLNLRGERGPSSFDQRHLADVTLQYTSGMGVGGGALMTGWRGKLLKDWTFLDSFQVGSGLPLTPLYSKIVGPVNIPTRASFNGQDIYAGSGETHLNPNALIAPLDGQWGNAGRNSIRGPAQFTMNASMQRSFKLSDRFNLALTINATNPLNHPTFRGYNTLITAGNLFGLVSNPQPMRSLSTEMRLTF
jgi:hypothetical protein